MAAQSDHHRAAGAVAGLLSMAVVTLAALACLAAGPPAASAAISGDELWRRVYDGPGHGGDTPTAVAIAPGGKFVYVAGAVTPTGTIKSDVGLIKYKAGGKRVWVRTWGSAAKDNDIAVAAVCDDRGNIYVGGSTTRAAGLDFLLIKYAPSGARRWVRTWNGTGKYDDGITALAVDANGNIYAAGYSWAAATGTDPALVKWTPTGKRAWAKTYPSAEADSFQCLVLDKKRGRVYAGGNDGVTSGRNWLLTRYSLGGKRVWASSVGDPNTYFLATSLALTPGGAVIMAGGSNTGSNATNDGRIGRWSATGTFVWSTGFYGSAGEYDVINDIAVDREGNLAAVGMAKQFADNYDAFLVAYKPDRSLRGSKYLGDIFNDSLTEVAFDARGNIYVAGKLGMNLSSSQFWAMKFSRGLVPRWQKVKKLSGLTADDHPTDIAVRTGTYPGFYVTGTAVTTGGGWDWLTLKYKP